MTCELNVRFLNVTGNHQVNQGKWDKQSSKCPLTNKVEAQEFHTASSNENINTNNTNKNSNAWSG